jgi:hypothetical protein
MPVTDPQVRLARQKGAAVRNSPDSYIRSLRRAKLTAEQKFHLIQLVMSFLDDGAEQPGGDAAGGAA